MMKLELNFERVSRVEKIGVEKTVQNDYGTN